MKIYKALPKCNIGGKVRLYATNCNKLEYPKVVSLNEISYDFKILLDKLGSASPFSRVQSIILYSWERILSEIYKVF